MIVIGNNKILKGEFGLSEKNRFSITPISYSRNANLIF